MTHNKTDNNSAFSTQSLRRPPRKGEKKKKEEGRKKWKKQLSCHADLWPKIESTKLTHSYSYYARSSKVKVEVRGREKSRNRNCSALRLPAGVALVLLPHSLLLCFRRGGKHKHHHNHADWDEKQLNSQHLLHLGLELAGHGVVNARRNTAAVTLKFLFQQGARALKQRTTCQT